MYLSLLQVPNLFAPVIDGKSKATLIALCAANAALTVTK